MTTKRNIRKYWTEVKHVIEVNGEPQVTMTICACGAPGATRRECATASGNKTPCPCACHEHTRKAGRSA